MRGRGPFFHMTQPEQIAPPAVADGVRERAKTLELKELTMKIAELSTKIDTLIGVAMTSKQVIDGQAAQAANIPEDDPEVAALAQRIDDAIAVLTGVPRTAPAGALAPSIDPNAPAV